MRKRQSRKICRWWIQPRLWPQVHDSRVGCIKGREIQRHLKWKQIGTKYQRRLPTKNGIILECLRRWMLLTLFHRRLGLGILIPLISFPGSAASSRMWLVGSRVGIMIAKSCEAHLECCVAKGMSATYRGVSDGSLETTLFSITRVFRPEFVSEPQTRRLESSSNNRRNGATVGSTRVYTDNALKQALMAWWARLWVKAVGSIAKHCSNVMPQ